MVKHNIFDKMVVVLKTYFAESTTVPQRQSISQRCSNLHSSKNVNCITPQSHREKGEKRKEKHINASIAKNMPANIRETADGGLISVDLPSKCADGTCSCTNRYERKIPVIDAFNYDVASSEGLELKSAEG